MAFVKDTFQALRRITFSGFSGDPDWVGDYTASIARLAGSKTCLPSRTGKVDLLFGYLDSNENLVAPGAASFIDFQIVGLGSGNLSKTTLDAIYSFETINNHKVDEVTTLDRTLNGPSILAIRVFGLVMTPGAAEELVAAIRIG